MNKLERDNISRRKLRAERKAMAIHLLGGACVNCGSTEQLEFDHVNNDRDSVRNTISQLFTSKIERLMAELEKCQLLCKPCHGEKTMADHGKFGKIHGVLSMYINKGCRCDGCRAANAKYMREYKQRARLAYGSHR